MGMFGLGQQGPEDFDPILWVAAEYRKGIVVACIEQ
jgi:hypothetical protein